MGHSALWGQNFFVTEITENPEMRVEASRESRKDSAQHPLAQGVLSDARPVLASPEHHRMSSEKGQTAAQVRVGSPVGDERINGHDGPQNIQQGSASLPARAQKILQGSPRRLPCRRPVWKPKVYKITHVDYGLKTGPQNRYEGRS